MDGRGRLAQSLTFLTRLRRAPAPAGHRGAPRYPVSEAMPAPYDAASPWAPRLRRAWIRLLRLRIPRGVGAAAVAAIVLGSVGFGIVRGGHLPVIVDAIHDARDQVANTAGFRIVELSVSGYRHLGREEVLAIARITGRSSLLFMDVDGARERLKASPWIADASIRKLLPGQLVIAIREREPFALWQKDRRVSVIADDGTVLEGFVAPPLFTLPLVVGRGADTRAKEFLALIDRHPALREQVLASILVAERRWNLRLRNGLDIRLPETGVAAALDRLAVLDRAARLLSRDIVTIDLRNANRVTVRMSERASQARQDLLKEQKKTTKKGGRV